MNVLAKQFTDLVSEPLTQQTRAHILSAAGVATVDELFQKETIFELTYRTRFLVQPCRKMDTDCLRVVYQSAPEHVWYNQGSDFVLASDPMVVFQVLRERIASGNPGQALPHDTLLPGYMRESTAWSIDNSIAERFIPLFNQGELFLYGHLEKLFNIMSFHHRYHDVVINEQIKNAREACHDRSATGQSMFTDNQLIEAYRSAMVKFILDQGLEFNFGGSKLEIYKDTGSYLLGETGMPAIGIPSTTYPATVNHYTMTLLSWEWCGTHVDEEEYGWMSNQSEYYGLASFNEAAAAFVERKNQKEPWIATRNGQKLEDIHAEEIKHRAPTEWEKSK